MRCSLLRMRVMFSDDFLINSLSIEDEDDAEEERRLLTLRLSLSLLADLADWFES